MIEIKMAIRDVLRELDEIALDNGQRRRLTPRERAILAAVGNLVHDVARTRPGVIDIDNGSVEIPRDQAELESSIKSD